MKNNLAIFEDYKIRRVYDEASESWFFSVVDVIQVLLQQTDFQIARKYWNKLKERLNKEGSQTVTNCHQLKMTAEDGRARKSEICFWKAGNIFFASSISIILKSLMSNPGVTMHVINEKDS